MLKMVCFHLIINKNNEINNPDRPEIPNHFYRILIIDGSG